jgi:PAS domain S-box-containing protein
MKGNLTRLGLAVKRELQEKEMRARQKKDEEALRQSEEKYRTILESIGDGYYEADIDGNFTFFNNALCRIWGYPPEELMGMNNRAYTDEETAQKLYQAHNKVYRTGEPGRLFDYEIIQKNGDRKVIQSSFTLLKDQDGKAIGFRGIVRDITDLKQMDKERQHSLEQLRKSLEATIHAMAVTVEARDPYTAGHQRRVADLAYAIALELHLENNRLSGLRMASTIHDLGKISIPSEILTKPTKLSNIEFEIVKTHAQAGYDILKDIDFPWPIARIVHEHHERMDGSGYPNHLKGEDTLLESKILTVADVVEAMASHRPYRASLGIEPALNEIIKNRGILYDPDIVDVCLRLFREKRFNFKA